MTHDAQLLDRVCSSSEQKEVAKIMRATGLSQAQAIEIFRNIAHENWERMQHISRHSFENLWQTKSVKALFLFDGRQVMSSTVFWAYNLIASLYIVVPIILAIVLSVRMSNALYLFAAVLPFLGAVRRLQVFPQRSQVELVVLIPLAIWVLISWGLSSVTTVCALSYIWGSYLALLLEHLEFAVQRNFATRDDITYETLLKRGLFQCRIKGQSTD